MLKGKTVVIAVSGSIAAYKMPNVCRMLKKLGADVQVLMTQNATHISWSGAEVDAKLHYIMQSIHEACVKFGQLPDGRVDYVKGANIAGFMKVAQAMLEQGII